LLTTIRSTARCETTVQFVAEEAIGSDLTFPDADAVRSVLKREEAGLLVFETTPKGRELEVLVEPLIPWPLLVILGGGHVGQAVAVQANLVGFEVMVIDDRPEFAVPERYPEGVTARCAKVDEAIGRLALGKDTYIVIVTRGHQHDAEALAACLSKPVAYLGMIGSRRKVALLRQDFLESGRATAEALDRVYAPIGLDIGAATVPEIATSIVAQLIAVRRLGTAPRISPRKVP
jgi:xanthine dehydrogenase accessory factor